MLSNDSALRSTGRICQRIILPQRAGGLVAAASGQLLRTRMPGIDLRLGKRRYLDRYQGAQYHHRRGGTIPYDRLLLATGAEPYGCRSRAPIIPHVHTLALAADCRAIIGRP